MTSSRFTFVRVTNDVFLTLLISYLEDKLEVKTGQVSKDGLVSVKKVECLGACVGGPMCQIGDQYYEHLTKEKLDNILEDLTWMKFALKT